MLAKLEADNACDAMELGQPGLALEHLAAMASHANAGYEDKPCHRADSRPLGQILREEYLTRACFDSLREDEEFQAIAQSIA